MEHQKFLEVYRRAIEIKMKADFGFILLRGIADSIKDQHSDLQAAERQLAEYRNAPDHHGSKWQRANIARLVVKAQAEVDEQRVWLDAMKGEQAIAQEQVNTYGPQRDACMKQIEQLRAERDATMNSQVYE